jgi:predicted AlkP superfamily pyrophosphatase or phosphodiesterase
VNIAGARLTTVIAVLLISAALAQDSRTRLVIISWDGNADWVIDRLVAENALPNVARLAKTGVRAAFVTPVFPSKTAPGHAAIWTGAWPNVSGVTGNSVPRLPKHLHTVLESQDGFHSSVLRAEPIWMSAVRAGKRVAILGATHSTPARPYLDAMRSAGIPADRLMSFDGFRSPIATAEVIDAARFGRASDWAGVRTIKDRALEAATKAGDAQFNILLFDDPADATDGFDSALVCKGHKIAADAGCDILKPHEAAETTNNWSRPFQTTRAQWFGSTYFRLFELAPDGSRIVLYRRASHGYESSTSRQTTDAYLRATGGFIDEGFGAYQAGRLGPRLWERGDGTAERRLVEIVRLSLEFHARGTRFAFERLDADVLLHYSSASDHAGHAWVGALDPDSPAYDAALADRIWPFYRQIFQLQDAWLGTVLDAAGPRAIVSLVGDHGMIGVNNTFHVNAALERAGLLARTPDGRIDLAKTQICAPPWGEYFVVLNSTDWKGGIVPPDSREVVLKRATEALLSAIDPESGRHIVTRVFRPSDVSGLGIDGKTGGDLYLDFAPGYAPSAALSADVVRKSPLPIGTGTHGFYPHRTKMQTVWFVAGPGVAVGRTIAGVRQIDIAPTLSVLFGAPIPRDAQGHVIREVVADSARVQ